MPSERNRPALELDRRSVARYVMVVLALGVPLLTVPGVAGLPAEPFILGSTIVLLFGGAVVTAHRAGAGGVARLFSGALRWRIGWRNWAVVVGAVPGATIAVAAITGTFTAPPDGWLSTVGSYLFFTFIFGALVINLWEELGWHGLVQRHLMQRHGLAKGAVLTAIPFAILHLPLQLLGASSTRETLVYAGLLFVLAPAMRYLLGSTDYATGGSLLAVGILHASFNASGNLDVIQGGWEHIVGLAIVAALALLTDVMRSRSSQPELGDQEAAKPAAQEAMSSR